MLTFEIPGLSHALQTLENRRKSDFEDWLVEKGWTLSSGPAMEILDARMQI